MNPPYIESTSRMEMLYRILYLIAFCIVMVIGKFLLYVTMPLQFLAMLIMAKRVEILHKFNQMMIEYGTGYAAYLGLLTDERPDFLPNFDRLK